MSEEPQLAEGTALVINPDGSLVGDEPVPGETGLNVSMSQLADMGFIAPVASPQMLRAAFAYKQRLYAAILDPSDYLYTVSYQEGNKTRQYVTGRREDAEKVATTYKVQVFAKPKKSGIVKLADALGIEATCTERQGLPGDPAATFSYVVYRAVHKRTGREAEGVGWCDLTERGGRISKHDVIATADTRAFNRAVLRLSGFGDVSADEIIAGASSEEADLPPFVPEPQALKPAAALPAYNDTHIVASCRAWAEGVASRSGEQFLPPAQQETKAFRELRARARRGDEGAARQLGTMGLRWSGGAQDSPGTEGFVVEEPTIKPADVAAVTAAAAASQHGSNGAQKQGWDLSGQGSDKDDPPPLPAADTASASTSNIPMPQPAADTITTAQAKSVSLLLMEVFGDKDRARTWLKTNAHVDRSSQVRTNQYEALMRALNDKKEETSA